MNRLDEVALRAVISELANALQSAVLITAQLQTKASEHGNAVANLERTLRRATATMQQLQPT